MGLYYIWRFSTCVCYRIMNSGIRNNMFPQIICSNIHKFYCIKGTPSNICKAPCMGTDSFEMINCTYTGKTTPGKKSCQIRWMPCDRTIHASECTISYHKSFSRSAFFSRTAIINYSALLSAFFKIALHSNCSSCRTHSQGMMPASMAKLLILYLFFLCTASFLAHPIQRIKFTQKGNFRFSGSINSPKSGRNSNQIFFYRKSLFFK